MSEYAPSVSAAEMSTRPWSGASSKGTPPVAPTIESPRTTDEGMAGAGVCCCDYLPTDGGDRDCACRPVKEHWRWHGEADLHRERLPRRLHRRRERQLRFRGAGRRCLRVHHRPPTPGKYVSLRASHVRDDGRVGDRPRSGRAIGAHGRVRRHLAGGRQGRVFDDTAGTGDRQDRTRAQLRRDGGPEVEGVGSRRSRHRRREPRRASVQSRPRRRVPLVPLPRHRRRREGRAPRDMRVELELLDERRFASGVAYVRYRVMPA